MGALRKETTVNPYYDLDSNFYKSKDDYFGGRVTKKTTEKLGKALPVTLMGGLMGTSISSGMYKKAMSNNNLDNLSNNPIFAGIEGLGAGAGVFGQMLGNETRTRDAIFANTISEKAKYKSLNATELASTGIRAGQNLGKLGMVGAMIPHAINGLGLGTVNPLSGLMASRVASLANPVNAVGYAGAGAMGVNPLASLMGGSLGPGGIATMMALGLGGGIISNKINQRAANNLIQSDRKEKLTPISASQAEQENDQYIQKYTGGLKLIRNQVQMLSLTGGLKSYEALSLNTLMMIASATARTAAFYDKADDENKNKKFNTSLFQNEYVNNFTSEEAYDVIGGHTSTRKKGGLEEFVDIINLKKKQFDKWFVEKANRISAAAILANPLVSAFGSLMGTPGERLISKIFGIDENQLEDKTYEKVSQNLGITVTAVSAANTPIEAMLKGESADEIKIKLLASSANILKHILQTTLDMRQNLVDGGGFFGETQDTFEQLGGLTDFQKWMRDIRKKMGTIPGLSILASIMAMKEGINFQNSEKEYEFNTRADIKSNQETRLDHQTLFYKLYTQSMPNIFLGMLNYIQNISTGITDILNCNNCKKSKTSMWSNKLSVHPEDGTISSSRNVKKYLKDKKSTELKNIDEHYKQLLKEYPSKSEEIHALWAEDIQNITAKYKNKASMFNKVFMNGSLKTNSITMQQHQDQEENEKKSGLILEYLKEISENTSFKKRMNQYNDPNNTKNSIGSLGESFKDLFNTKGSYFGKMWKFTKTLGYALSSIIFTLVKKAKTGGLLFSASLAFVSWYIYDNKEKFKELISVGKTSLEGISTVFGTMSDMALGAGGVALTASAIINRKNIFTEASLYLFKKIRKTKMKTVFALLATALLVNEYQDEISTGLTKVSEKISNITGLDLGEIDAGYISGGLTAAAMAPVLLDLYRTIKIKGKNGIKIKQAIGLAGLALTGASFFKENLVSDLMKTIFKPFASLLDDKEERTQEDNYGLVLESLGLGMMTLPNPYMKLGGALFFLAGIGVSNWSKITSSLKNVWMKLIDSMPPIVQDAMFASGIADKKDFMKYQQRIEEMKNSTDTRLFAKNNLDQNLTFVDAKINPNAKKYNENVIKYGIKNAKNAGIANSDGSLNYNNFIDSLTLNNEEDRNRLLSLAKNIAATSKDKSLIDNEEEMKKLILAATQIINEEKEKAKNNLSSNYYEDHNIKDYGLLDEVTSKMSDLANVIAANQKILGEAINLQRATKTIKVISADPSMVLQPTY